MKKRLLIFWCLIQLLCHTTSVNSNEIRQKRTAVFPLRSFYDLFVAIIFPLEMKNVFISYNLSINYYLPFNTTEWGDMSLFAPITEINLKRQLTKRSLYVAFEDKLNRLGFSGRSCLLRIICEASTTKLYNNGVLGDILHIMLTPSSSWDEGLPFEFYHAEKQGHYEDCTEYINRCPESFLDTISRFE